MAKSENNYAQKVIFELTHNWSIAPKGAKSLGINDKGHRVYECTMRHTQNVVRLHLIVNNDIKVLAVEPNSTLTVKDYLGLTKIGNKIESKCGLSFECDKLVEKDLNITVVPRESTVMDTVVEKALKATDEVKLKKKLEAKSKLEAKLKKMTAEVETMQGNTAKSSKKQAA